MKRESQMLISGLIALFGFPFIAVVGGHGAAILGLMLFFPMDRDNVLFQLSGWLGLVMVSIGLFSTSKVRSPTIRLIGFAAMLFCAAHLLTSWPWGGGGSESWITGIPFLVGTIWGIPLAITDLRIAKRDAWLKARGIHATNERETGSW